MKQERIKILEMLEQGKITVDDATKLFEALKDLGGNYTGEYWNSEEKLGKFSNNVDEFAKDFGSRIRTTYKEIEPKLKKASKKVVEKTAVIIDEISKSLNEKLKNMEETSEDNDCCEDNECCCDDTPIEN